MGLIVQHKALRAAAGLQSVLPIIRKRDRDLFDQVRRAMNSVVLNIAEAEGNDAGTARARLAELDIALDEVCAMSWRLSGR